MQVFRYAATIFMAVAMLLLLTGCNEITNLPLGNDTIVEYEVDEFGTPSYRWRWRYGLISGEIEVLSCEGFITDFGGGESFWDNIPFLSSMRIMQENEDEMLAVGDTFRFEEMKEHENEMLVSGDAFVLQGGGFWDYLQIRVNGVLVRHRWPLVDSGALVQFGYMGFTTEMLNLNIGRNKVVLTAIAGNNCVIRTIYLIRNE